MPPTPTTQPAANAGNHAQAFAALPPDQQAALVACAQHLQGLNIDWQKLLQNLPQLIALIKSLFGGTAAQPAGATPSKP